MWTSYIGEQNVACRMDMDFLVPLFKLFIFDIAEMREFDAAYLTEISANLPNKYDGHAIASQIASLSISAFISVRRTSKIQIF